VLWLLICLALVVFALAVWTLLGLRLWRQTKALGRELKTASERLDATREAIGVLGEPQPDAGAEPARAAVRSGRHAAVGARAPHAPEWDVRRQGRRSR
jgi:hypothetical protein